MMIPLGIVIIAVIVVPWYAALYQEHGWTYIKSFLISENVERFTSGVGVRQHRGPWFYLPVVLERFVPVVGAAAVRRGGGVEGRAPASRRCCGAGSRAIVGVLLALGREAGPLHLSDRAGRGGARRPGDRARPVGRAVDDVGDRHAGRHRRAARARRRGGAVSCSRPPAASTRSTAALIVGGRRARRRRRSRSFFGVTRRPAAAALSLLAAVVAVNWAFVLRVLPEFERYKPVPAFSRTLQERLAAGRRRRALPGRRCRAWSSTCAGTWTSTSTSRRSSARSAPAGGSTRCCRPTTTPRWRRRSPPSPACIDRRPTFEVKLRQVLARQPLPELLLITQPVASDVTE